MSAELIALRRELHQHPELSGQEEGTARRLEAHLRAAGLSPRRVAGTGLALDLPGLREDLPRVALRADTDALPLAEETGLPFASRHPGVMHACGHDGHAAMLVGAALGLARRPALAPVRLLWQPAEETGAGAPALIAEGALDGVAMIFGGHLDNRYPSGQLVVQEGPVNASADTFWLRVRGRQAHGGRPHEGVDAILVASLLVTALQALVAREVDPARPAVVSVGTLRAGHAPNVIAGEAELGGTIRTQHPEVRAQLLASLRRVCAAVGQLHRAEVDVEVQAIAPPLVNAPGPAALARAAAEEVVGPEGVVGLRGANMGAEDFAWYLEHVPGAYVRFGGGREGAGPAHSGRFDFDEGALGPGAAWMEAVARRAGAALAGRGG